MFELNFMAVHPIDVEEGEQLALWCSHSNLELNTLSTMELTVVISRNPRSLIPFTIDDCTVSAVDSFRFLVYT